MQVGKRKVNGVKLCANYLEFNSLAVIIVIKILVELLEIIY